MNVLITGKNGFIGHNLTEKLRDCNLTALGRNELDLQDTKAVEDYLHKNDFDVILHTANVHLAGDLVTQKYNTLDGNLRMFFNLQRCSGCYGKMYYFGSGAEYDMQHYIPDMREEYFDTYIPSDAYGFSKYIMSKECCGSENIYDLRLFGVYGKYERWERRFISNAICRALKGKAITIQKNVYFDYIWVEDLCDIVQWFLEHEPEHRHYNVCRGSKIDLYTLAQLIREILGIDCDIIVAEAGWKPEYTGNNERLLAELGDYHFTDFRESIVQLCRYYKENIDMIDEEKLL